MSGVLAVFGFAYTRRRAG
nr:hypothetical protein [Xylophilus sp. ASV27]